MIDVRYNVATTCCRLGDVYMQLGDTQQALAAFEDYNTLCKEVLAMGRDNLTTRRELLVSEARLGGVYTELLEFDSAIEHYSAASMILDELIETGIDDAIFRQQRDVVEGELRYLRNTAKNMRAVLSDFDTFIREPGARSRLAERISLLAGAGRFDEIPESAAMLRSLDAENPENLYNAACGYSLCANAIAAADGAELPPEQLAQRQEYIDLALACLREAIAAGWSDIEYMQQDPVLDVLRDLPEFIELKPVNEPAQMAE
jgi:tetratricopeptide (TPR) repeat protein